MSGSPAMSQSGDDSDEGVRIDRPRLCYTDGEGRAREITLSKPRSPVVIGRAANAHVPLIWDPEVGGYHAVIEWLGTQWTLADQQSRNGTFVNGVRVTSRRRLVSGDRIRMGNTTLTVEDLPPEPAGPTSSDSDEPPSSPLTAAQRAVLIRLCEPFKHNPRFAIPPSNDEIAAELRIGVDAVRKHLQAMYEKFEVDDNAPPNQKRIRLVERAIRAGEVGDGDHL